MNKLEIIIDGNIYYYDSDTFLYSIAEDFKDKYDSPILVASIDNEIYELYKKVKRNCEIKFITMKDRFGNKIYQKGLIFLLNAAFTELYGTRYKIRVAHSIDKAIKVETNIGLTLERLNSIKDKMNELVKQDIVIEKCLIKRKEAQNYFNKIEDYNKANTFLYVTNHYVNLYKLNNTYNYLYSDMPHSTSCFISFDLEYVDNHTFILKFPGYNDEEIPKYTKRPRIEAAYKDQYEICKSFNITTSSDLNKVVSEGNINSLIKLDEVMASNNLLNIAKQISDNKNIKLVLLAGPSSSGKTTTAKKLSLYLKSFGLNPKQLSIDNYFLERKDTPKLENGEYDFESINAVDIKLFNDHLERLLEGEEVETPTFDFISGEKKYLKTYLKLEDNDILIIEGLHAINEELTKNISKDKKYKIYVSPFISLNIDNLNPISTTDVRLLRRIIRDNRTRGYNVLDTLKQWDNVRSGEEKNIFPFQEEVDAIYNTGLIYECGILKLYALPLLYEIKPDSIYYEQVRKLIRFLDMFLAIPSDSVPEESILREFIGKSFFE